MNKTVLSSLFLLSFLPACFWQSPKKTVTTQAVSETGFVVNRSEKKHSDEKTDKKSVFDPDVEAFVLEEDDNPFTYSLDDKSELLVVEDVDDEQEDHTREGLKAIYFDYDQYSLRDDQKATLDHNLKRALQLIAEGKTIVIEGHSCEFAKDGVYNVMISEKRARTIADYLIAHGVNPRSLKVVGRGCEMPIVAHGTMEQQAPNRRVESYTLNV
jgi:outer membrane protein OmpA-like peptidoglycan-associated protein